MPSHTRRSKSINRPGKKNNTRRRARIRSLSRPKKIRTTNLGEGGFGVVARPPAHCKHFFSKHSANINARNINSIVFQEVYLGNPNYVSKTTEYLEAAREMKIADTIREKIPDWRDYYCLVEFICPAEKVVYKGYTEYDTYAISKFCGVTLDSILSRVVYLTPAELCGLVDALKWFIAGVLKLHEHNIFHGDLHDGNILYNPVDKQMRLIDFGLAKDKSGSAKLDILYSRLEDVTSLINYVMKELLIGILTILDTLPNPKTLTLHRCITRMETVLNEIHEIHSIMDRNGRSMAETLHILMGFLETFLESA